MTSRGQWAHDRVDWVLQRLEAEGKAMIRRRDPSIGVDHRGKPFFRAGGFPDYVGALPSGRMVVFDLKSCVKKRWRLAAGTEDNDRRAARQEDFLVKAGSEYRCLAGFLFVFQNDKNQILGIWIPWQNLDKLAGRSWTPDELLKETGGAVAIVWPIDGSRDPDILGAALALEAAMEGARVRSQENAPAENAPPAGAN